MLTEVIIYYPSASIECEKLFMEYRDMSIITDKFFLFHLQTDCTWVWLDFMENLEISVMSHCTLRKSSCAFSPWRSKDIKNVFKVYCH